MRRKKLVIFTIAFSFLLSFSAPILARGYIEIKNAETAWDAGDYGSASTSFAHAARLLPWRKDLWEKAGIAAGLNDDPGMAILHLMQAGDLSEQGWFILGSSYFKTGDSKSAMNSYREGLLVYDSYSLYAGLRLIYLTEKNWPAEKVVLENLVRLKAEDAFSHYRLGLLLTVLEPEQALPNLMTAVRLDPQFEPAVQTLRVALNVRSSQPDKSQQMVTIGRALGLVQEWDLAVHAFMRGIEYDPENAEAWAWLGEAQQQTGEDGRESLDRALSLDHVSATVRALRGLYWSRQEKYPQMLAEYLLAAEYEPENPAWQASIGDAYQKMGDLVSAFDAYRQAAELAPMDSTYWRLLALFCAESGVHIDDTGLPAAQKAVELAPGDPLALDVLGFSYYSSGRFANAEQILTQAAELAPDFIPAKLHLALTYLAQGNRTEAFNLLSFIRNADPEGMDGKMANELLLKYFP